MDVIDATRAFVEHLKCDGFGHWTDAADVVVFRSDQLIGLLSRYDEAVDTLEERGPVFIHDVTIYVADVTDDEAEPAVLFAVAERLDDVVEVTLICTDDGERFRTLPFSFELDETGEWFSVNDDGHDVAGIMKLLVCMFASYRRMQDWQLERVEPAGHA